MSLIYPRYSVASSGVKREPVSKNWFERLRPCLPRICKEKTHQWARYVECEGCHPSPVVQDLFVSSEITASCLADLFGTLKRKERLDLSVAYTFPLVMDVSEVEFLKPYGFLSFRDFFRRYRQERNITPPDDETFVHFRQIMNRISLCFFKKPLEPES